MARKHSNPLDDPPAATSSEEHDEELEEEEEEEEEESEEEEEEDEGQEQQQHAQPDGSETEEEDEEEEDEDDDDDEEAAKDRARPHPLLSKPVSKDDDDDDDTETESDADPKSPGVSAFTIKPYTSKPEAAAPSSPASVKPKKPAAAKPASENKEPVLVSLKRAAEGEDAKPRAKKVKADNGGGGEEEGGVSEKKGGGHVNRLWNEQDEVAILKGMIEFHGETGVDPNSDSAAFLEFVKKDLSVGVSKCQLMDKVRRLKRKYWANAAAKGEKRQDPVFTRPHEAKAFELSKKVWGGAGLKTRKTRKKKNPVDQNATPANEVATVNGNAAIAVAVPKEESVIAVNDKLEQGKEQSERAFSELYPFLSISLKKGSFGADLISKDWAEAMQSYLKYVEKSKLEELEEEWKKQILAENDVYMRRSSLLQKQFQLLSDWRV